MFIFLSVFLLFFFYFFFFFFLSTARRGAATAAISHKGTPRPVQTAQAMSQVTFP
jgi:hypothetical protein